MITPLQGWYSDCLNDRALPYPVAIALSGLV